MALLAVPPLKLWPLVAATVAATMLATAHSFERFGGFEPCALCLRQREVYWAALVVGVLGAAAARGELRRVVALALGALFTAGLIVAVYHSGAEWKWWPGPETCAASAGAVSAKALGDLLSGATVRPPACDEASWRLLGLSMAGWNALISAGLACASFTLAFRKDRR